MRRRICGARINPQRQRRSAQAGSGTPDGVEELPGVIKWFANPPAPNLPLAARPRVGHIGPDGAVAEWLKAAVC